MGLEPVVHERGLELRDHGSFDSKVGVAPVLRVLGVAQPLVGHTHPAGEPDAPVHDQQLPVGAMIEVVELVKVERTVEHHLDARLSKPLDVVLVDFLGSRPVDHDMRAHAGPGALGERRGELVSDRRRPVDVALEGDRPARRADGREHGREGLVAVVERGDLVAGHETGAEQTPHRPHELRIGGGVAVGKGVRHLALGARQVDVQENDHERGTHRQDDLGGAESPPALGQTRDFFGQRSLRRHAGTSVEEASLI